MAETLKSKNSDKIEISSKMKELEREKSGFINKSDRTDTTEEIKSGNYKIDENKIDEGMMEYPKDVDRKRIRQILEESIINPNPQS